MLQLHKLVRADQGAHDLGNYWQVVDLGPLMYTMVVDVTGGCTLVERYSSTG